MFRTATVRSCFLDTRWGCRIVHLALMYTEKKYDKTWLVTTFNSVGVACFPYNLSVWSTTNYLNDVDQTKYYENVTDYQLTFDFYGGNNLLFCVDSFTTPQRSLPRALVPRPTILVHHLSQDSIATDATCATIAQRSGSTNQGEDGPWGEDRKWLIWYDGKVKEESDVVFSQSPSIASKLNNVLAAACDEPIKARADWPAISQVLSFSLPIFLALSVPCLRQRRTC